MLTAKNAQTAAFFTPDGQPLLDEATGKQLCLSYTLAAEANYKFMSAAGILPAASSPEEQREKIYNTPMLRFLSAIAVMDPQRRAALTHDIQRDLQERTRQYIRLAPQALPFMWRSSSCFLVEYDDATGQDRIWMNVRSHRTPLTIARNTASGSGYMSAKDHIETAEETAARELREESGIDIRPQDIVPLGYAMRNIPVKMPSLATIDGGTTPGIMTEFTYYGFAFMPPEGPAAITLSSESFGSIAYSYKDLQALAHGTAIDTVFYASDAPFAEKFVDDVRRKTNQENAPFTLGALADHVEETGLLSKNDHGQKGRLALHDPIAVRIAPIDFRMGTINWIANAMKVLQTLGQPASEKDLRYVQDNSCIDMPANECADTLEGILPAIKGQAFAAHAL